MKTLYIDCGMGCAGDMLGAALLELLPEEEQKDVLAQMNALGLEAVSVSAEKVQRAGIAGTQMHVVIAGEEEESVDVHEHHHEHTDTSSVPSGDSCLRSAPVGEEPPSPGRCTPSRGSHDDHHDHHHDHEHHHDHGLPLEGKVASPQAMTDEVPPHHSHHHHHHTSLADIEAVIAAMPVADAVKADVRAVYRLLAEAEAHAHGTEAGAVHFHEVGTMDAVADITLACLLLHRLRPEHIVASPVHVGSGKVRCAHGILPVPAPATAYLLQGIPSYGGDLKAELCTPTGAALLKHFAKDFSPMPVMRTEKTGYGCGKKEFEGYANLLRVQIGEAEEKKDTVIEFVTNVDDMTPEDTGFASEQLFAAGAIEVYTQTVYMKKNRPGLLLSVMCREEDRERVLQALFRHTTTIGVREYKSVRHVLERTIETRKTAYGDVRVKTSTGFGVTREKWEHDDLERIAREHGLGIAEVRQNLLKPE